MTSSENLENTAPLRSPNSRSRLLELAILGTLKDRPDHALHGYELRKCLREKLGLFYSISFGSLYPALARLLKEGAIQEINYKSQNPPVVLSVPMTGSLQGELAAYKDQTKNTVTGDTQTNHPGNQNPTTRRVRKVYKITQYGETLFARLLKTDLGNNTDNRYFMLKLTFAQYLDPITRLQLFQQRKAHLLGYLKYSTSKSPSETSANPDPYTTSMLEYTVENTKRELDWIEELIETERTTERSIN
ncbi:MAG: PadR family transcriptional regulator [Actinobacteria bacterium]|jgi:DNA-binding PadR family transcriptional regulator|nr:PadR family transcriptional regulator [Actinomycetota bacterium]MCL6104268.1 PadR family transcriptional regulator [Actinomycetota bacterium]